jgi:hypothetical protein
MSKREFPISASKKNAHRKKNTKISEYFGYRYRIRIKHWGAMPDSDLVFNNRLLEYSKKGIRSTFSRSDPLFGPEVF